MKISIKNDNIYYDTYYDFLSNYLIMFFGVYITNGWREKFAEKHAIGGFLKILYFQNHKRLSDGV